jgi:hypothetical protein
MTGWRIWKRSGGAAALVSAAVLGLCATAARAWDNQGHMATGAIAYDALSRRDPRLVAEIVRLMASHPDRARFARELAGTPPTSRDRRLFEYMARWPDDVDEPAHHDPWHYQVRGAMDWGWLVPVMAGMAEAALVRQSAIAADPKAAAADRAVALCWIFHIVGDMQQPLHAAYWVDWRFPKSDRAGTRAWVRRAAGTRPLSLHSFWDEAARVPEPEVQGADDLAARLEREHPEDGRARLGLPSVQGAFETWSAEGRRLARDVAYRHGDFAAAADKAKAPVVSAEYTATAHTVADQRIALGGWRLAAFLAAEMPGH